MPPDLPEDPICESQSYSVCEGDIAMWYDSCDRKQGVRENCAPNPCVDGECLVPSCDDGLRNGNETDVDCAGDCPPCENGESCLVHFDCASGSCQGGVCAAAACDDQLLNGDETDVDCGGSCAGCGIGDRCTGGSDCQSNTCQNGFCVASFCSDGQTNGLETDEDCGGPDCGPCQGGQDCSVATDCLSQTCNNGVCEYFDCPSGMSRIGSTASCADHHEASVFGNTSCSGSQFGTGNSDNYPSGFPDAAASEGCTGTCKGVSVVEPSSPVYACSKAGVLPSANLTWFQAKRACENSGKHLCRLPGEWRPACAGDPVGAFPYGNSYEMGRCNGGEAGNGAAIGTGSKSGCRGRGFSSGIYDMSGNVWEWTETCPNGCLQGGGAYGDLEAHLSCEGGTLEVNVDYSGPSAGFRCCWTPGD